MKTSRTLQLVAFLFLVNVSFSQEKNQTNVSNDINTKDQILVCSLSRCHRTCELPLRNELIIPNVKEDVKKEEFTFSVFPNPATDKINIKLDEKISDFKLVIIDMLGNQVLEKSFTNFEIRAINVSNLKNGCYLVKLVSGEKSAIKQLIINK